MIDFGLYTNVGSREINEDYVIYEQKNNSYVFVLACSGSGRRLPGQPSSGTPVPLHRGLTPGAWSLQGPRHPSAEASPPPVGPDQMPMPQELTQTAGELGLRPGSLRPLPEQPRPGGRGLRSGKSGELSPALESPSLHSAPPVGGAEGT